MIRTVFALSLVALTAACGTPETGSQTAATAHARRADQFTCTTDAGLTVIYSTTSFFGQPTLSIVQGETTKPLVQTQGHGIKVLKQGTSSAVSVSKIIPDRETRTWTLTVPEIVLPEHANAAPFKTELKETVEPTSIAGPLPGQTPTTTVHPATCQAAFVIF